MKYFIEGPSARMSIEEWNDSLDVKIEDRGAGPGSAWRMTGAMVVSKQDARALAIALLNMSGNASALPKKLRWED